MTDATLTRQALALMRSCEDYVDDARIGAPQNNTAAGSILTIITCRPRCDTERAVRDALAIIDMEEGRTEK